MNRADGYAPGGSNEKSFQNVPQTSVDALNSLTINVVFGTRHHAPGNRFVRDANTRRVRTVEPAYVNPAFRSISLRLSTDLSFS
jgi:hypothetical protein